MKKSKILSFLLSISMIVSLCPQLSFAASGNTDGKGERQVYLHAFENTPNVTESVNRTTVYMGDTANIYFAVDKPNKGDTLSKDNPIVQEAAERERIAAEQRADNLGLSGDEKQEYIEYEVAKAVKLARHCEPQYDLQGYTVKIYFDTKYFKPASLDTKDAIDYKIPNEDKDFGIIDEGQAENEEVSVLPGYMTYKPEVHYQEPVQGDDESRVGWVSTTVFLMNTGFFPNKSESLWYNLCKLALIPKQTGHTSVRLDYDTSDDDTLELFAKNVDDEKLNFNADVKNDGIFYINIDDKNKPSPPRPDNDHPAGTYNEEINIGLVHDNSEPCQIFYTTDGVTDPRIEGNANVKEFVNGDEIHLIGSTVIKTAAKRVSDGKWSDVKSYTFNFRPKAPYLFNSSGKMIPNIYNEVWSEDGYSVIAFDTSDYSAGMTAGTKVYYTFNSEISPDYISDNPNGTDAENGWVGTLTGLIADKINRSRVMRLVTVNKWGASDVSVYYLGVKPDKVTASPGSGLDREQPITLSCQTPNAKIYYTLNGGDPRSGGELYTQPITLSTDTVIKAAALYNGKWSDVTSFWYLFTSTSGVTAFYPSGTYTGSVDVVLYPNEPGKAIKISYNDGINWTDYNGETMHIECYTKFRAKTADIVGMGDEFVYIVKPYAPVFSPESAQFTSSDTVTVFNPPENGDGCELWYTTDGSEPTENDKADGDFVKIDITKYTTVKAVIVKDGKYKSEVVTNTYGVVYGKPAKPLTTLLPGFYTRENGSGEITTKFKQAGENIDIYYTIGIGDDPGMTPDIHNVGNGTYKYSGEDIEVIDSMTINAVAVKNINGELVQSDLATFYYLITPEAPKAAPSANVEKLPVVPVETLTVQSSGSGRCVIKYTVGNENDGYFSGEFENSYTDGENPQDYTRFYIDTKTGNAYRNPDLSGEPLCRLDKSFNDTALLVLSCELDGVLSQENAYIYLVDTENRPLIPPYADKNSGTYTESKDNFVVKLYSVYSESDNIKIQWKYEDDAEWTDYSDTSKPEFKTEDKILYIRTADKANSDKVSESVGYVYYFVPPAPVITPVSGVYKKSDNTEILIKQPDNKPEDVNYKLYYSQSTDGQWGNTNGDFPYYKIDASKTVKAYIKNMITGRMSETTYAVYIAEDDNVLGGAVSIKSPFDKKRISAHLLGKGDYASGILFNPTENVIYRYRYTFTPEAGGGFYQSDNIRFEPKNALVPTEKMDTVTVNAWIDGEKQTTEINHTIDIVHLDIPKVSVLGTPDSSGSYSKGTKYYVENIYPTDNNIIVYYTTDGSDPTKSTARKKFTLTDKGAEETLSATTTIKTVYYSACGDTDCEACQSGNYENCPNSIYGEVGTYTYTVPEIKYSGGGGGGGSRVVDNTRKYTKDIFGNEHPTHIGYINGYPDGSVKPNGKITREEITAILYRITNHDYEKPFVATGEMFPDVNTGRWSAHDIEYMSDKGIVNGYPDGEFKPGKNLTRAEFAALIRRFTGIKQSDAQNIFPDLTDNHWAYDDIMALYGAGMLSGYEDGTIRPENEISRAEVMKIVNLLLGRNPSEPYVKSLDFNPFSDLKKDKWYYTTVLEATVTHNYYLDDKNVEIKWEDCK